MYQKTDDLLDEYIDTETYPHILFDYACTGDHQDGGLLGVGHIEEGKTHRRNHWTKIVYFILFLLLHSEINNPTFYKIEDGTKF